MNRWANRPGPELGKVMDGRADSMARRRWVEVLPSSMVSLVANCYPAACELFT